MNFHEKVLRTFSWGLVVGTLVFAYWLGCHAWGVNPW